MLEAHDRIRPHVLRTPLIPSRHLSRMTGADVYLKMESEQYTNSFKVRGATNKLLSLRSMTDHSDGKRRIRVVTASTGNHAQGVAR
ncbi:MAG: pyridoxal-phosphate dependent enzyme, partial [Candidatus Latescibacteria bacterium]|nr:pyridoxal-phosphate dependent enzyme [Candidatus Latescibacterota bacterium]